MTSSKFSRKASRKLPAVCRRYLAGLPPTYATGEPNRLGTFAVWKDVPYAFDLAESFPLLAGPGPNEWTGWSQQTELNLAVHVEHITATDRFNFTLYLRRDLAVINAVYWLNVELPPRPPFNSGLLLTPYPPPYPSTRLHVLD